MSILQELLQVRRANAAAAAAAASFNSHAASVGFSAASYNSMEPEQTTPEDRERQRQILDATIDSILPRVESFTRLLTEPPRREAVRNSAGVLDPPLGATRLSVARLVSALLATNHQAVNARLVECRTLDALIDLFFRLVVLARFIHFLN